MVGTRNIVADRLRRMRPDEDRARIADSFHQTLGIVGENFEMLRRKLIDQRDRIIELAHDDNRAEFVPRRAGDFCPRQRLELRLDGLLDAVG